MVEPVDPPSPPHSATSKQLSGDAAKPPKKRKPTTTTHPPKRPLIINLSSSNSDETKDTASSNPENHEEDEQVNIEDAVLYRELEEYEIRNGVNPVTNHNHMRRFCFPYIHMGVGNEGGWASKIRHLKYKFMNQGDLLVPPHQMLEFLLWKKMFARNPPPDAESRTS
ncbi:hypothetical protein L1987_26575 [Smallanthus sonchifolius]|uniref:Uncharacterized protein n=1 Tax=Smallanthus sonchifolius TaxID=185202 RepID=A0ACB9I9M2_9ASTR|nr:hypothetical protein L1987_26575 [Smallanthus sonchifolius]